jgi:hypothetical protein
VVPTPQGPLTVTYPVLVDLIWPSLYVTGGWAELAATIQGVYQLSGLPGGGPGLAAPPPPDYQNGREAQVANNCVDTDNPRDASRYPAIARAADRRSPYFGSPWTYVSLRCAGWPARDRDRYTGPWDRPTARPVLLVGVTTDPATPYRDALTTRRELARARLLTLDGWGHTAFLQGSACVDAFETAYLLAGDLPPEGTRCRPDVPPFAAPPGPGAAARPVAPLPAPI